MKRASKILAGGAVALLIGCLVWLVGMSLISWDFYRLDTAKYTERSYACESDVTSISVNLSSFPLTVKKGDSVSLDYYEADNSEVFVEEKNGVLSVVENYKYRPFSAGLFNVGRFAHKFSLTVVSGAKLEINGSNSDISISDVTFDEFTINGANANIRFTDVEFGKLNMDVDNCDIEFKNCTIGALSIVGVNTDCEVKGSTFDSMSVRTCNADISMGNCKASELKVNATNLEITTENCEFKSVVLDSTNADCELSRAVLDKLKIDATNLDADIEIVGKESEYTVKTSGRRMPTNRTGTTDKLIQLSGTNNDVTLKFV